MRNRGRPFHFTDMHYVYNYRGPQRKIRPHRYAMMNRELFSCRVIPDQTSFYQKSRIKSTRFECLLYGIYN